MPENFDFVGLTLHMWVVPSIAMFLIALSAVFVLVHYRVERNSYDDGWGLAATVAGVFGAIVLVIAAIFAVPFDPKYWGIYRVETNVVSVTNSFTDASGEYTSEPVVQFEGIDVPVAVSDPRFNSLKGEDVTLTCSPVWHYQAADTYTCAIYKIGG